MSSLNQVNLIGNLGADPEVRSMQSGDEVCNFTLATSERWKDKNGDQQEKTEWHRVVIFSPGLVNVCKNYLKKGSKVYISGQLQTRSWEKDGQKQYTTEIVLRGYNASMIMLDGKSNTDQSYSSNDTAQTQEPQPHDGGMDDEIPFAPIPNEVA